MNNSLINFNIFLIMHEMVFGMTSITFFLQNFDLIHIPNFSPDRRFCTKSVMATGTTPATPLCDSPSWMNTASKNTAR